MASRPSARLVSSFAVLVAASGLPALATAAPSSAAVCADAEEMRFLDLLNEYRAQQGLDPLALSQTLSEAAEHHSADMAAKGYFAHTMADGTTVEQNLRNFGYTDGTFGENILAGTETASGALQTWQNSPSHDANMRRGAFEAIGIGRVNDPSSAYGWYWTTIFGGALDEPGTVCGQESPTRDGRRGRVNDPDVNLRSGPGRDSDVLRVLEDGTGVTVTGGAENGYLPVEVGGVAGWVAAEWIDLEEASAPAARPVVTETVNLRTGPSREAAVATIVPGGSAVELTGREQTGYVEAIWEGTTGWIDAAYVAAPAAAPGGSDPASAAQPAPVAGSATTTTDVNLRSAPDPASSVIAVVPAGVVVALTGEQQAGYLGVSVDGTAGWMDAAYLR